MTALVSPMLGVRQQQRLPGARVDRATDAGRGSAQPTIPVEDGVRLASHRRGGVAVVGAEQPRAPSRSAQVLTSTAQRYFCGVERSLAAGTSFHWSGSSFDLYIDG